MTLNSDDPREALTPGDRESNATGEASPIVEQAQRPSEAESSDFDAAVSSLEHLTDDQLERLAEELRVTFANHLSDVRTTETEDAVCLAACARILLRRRRSAVRQARAAEVVRNLAHHGRGA